MNRLADKVAIVTGGGLGIGRAIAKIFAAEGATVLVSDIDQDAGTQTANEIIGAGGAASFFHGDVSQRVDMEEMARYAIESFGQIDILVANAGIFPETPLDEMEEADWDRVLDINLKGVFLTVKACLPFLKERPAGRILITSSITGNRTGISGLTHYAASKAGINGFIRTAAMELAKHTITVNGVEPGNVLTEGMESQLGADYIAAQEEAIPLGRMADPEDIAYAMLFLATDEASYITGQTIIVDGGQTLPESKFAL
ncbi:MAG: SDR family oxidoreductase [Anaerolineae bacterium]